MFNRVILHDVTIYDLQEQQFIRGNIISAKIEYLPLLKKEISLRSVSLLDGRINIYKKHADSTANYQFILDAFASSEKEPSKLNLRLNSFIIRRTQISYNELYKPQTPQKFNLSHVRISDLDANISLKRLTPDELIFRIRHLSLKESSGLQVKKLTMRVTADRKRCHISDFKLQLPGSIISENNLYAQYDAADISQIIKTIRLHGRIRQAHISANDVMCFLPQLQYVGASFELSTDFNITPQSISLSAIDIYGCDGCLELKGKVLMKRRDGKIVHTDIHAEKVKMASEAVRPIAGKYLKNPVQNVINYLGDITLAGTCSLPSQGNKQIQAEIMTGVGEVNISAQWQGQTCTAQISSPLLDFTSLSKEKLPQSIGFKADVYADFTDKKQPDASLDLCIEHLAYRGYVYKDITVDADLAQANLALVSQCTDPNLNLSVRLKGVIDEKQFKSLALQADIRNIAPSKLNMFSRQGMENISAKVSLELPQIIGTRWSGTLDVTDFVKIGKSFEDTYKLDRFHLALAPSFRGTSLVLDSDFGHAEVDGVLSVSSLMESVQHILGKAFQKTNSDNRPIISKMSGRDWPEWQFSATLFKTDFFNKVLNLPLAIDGPVNIEGNLRADGQRFSIIGGTAGFDFKNLAVKDFSFYLSGENDEFSCLTQGTKKIGKNDTRFALTNKAYNGTMASQLTWSDNAQKFFGQIKTNTYRKLSPTGQHIISTDILPTDITISDSTWLVNGGNVSFSDRRVDVSGIRISHRDQSLSLGGSLTSSLQDSIKVQLHRIDVGFILNLINLQPVSFSGLATGSIYAGKDVGGNFLIDGRLNVPDFHFNEGKMGDAAVNLKFSTGNKRLYINADMQEDQVSRTQVNGYVGIAEKALDLHVQSQNTNLHFLRRYISNIFGDITGRTSGKCRIYGTFKKLDFEGYERARMGATVLATGCRYDVSDGRITMLPGIFDFKDFTLTDIRGGRGKLNGKLKHEHLKRITYDFAVEANHLMAYDKDKDVDTPFSATAIGTGNIHLSGSPGLINADISLKPENGTMIVYAVNNPTVFGDNTLLSFQNKVLQPVEAETDSAFSISGVTGIVEQTIATLPQPVEDEQLPNTTDIHLNFLIDMQPEAALKIIMDEKRGDYLILHGSGPLRATFHNKGLFQLFGTYTVDRGSYKMAIQDLIRKDFQFQRGGTLTFSGLPFEGDLDMQAVYTVPSVSLSDLGLGSGFSDNSVRADCILKLSGKALAPQISFDLNLPNVSDDVKQMVRRLISSEEDMNMQILYLLGIGRFYTYNFASSQAAIDGQSQSSVAMKSFLSNTLSGQLNNIISNVVGSSKWSFGTNLSTGQIGWSDMEVAGILSGRLLNNRLLINGNFGYRDRAASTTNFVGDFDINYLLTPDGSVNLKAYSETNDRYFSKSSMTTQGIGIQLKRDFTNFRDLFTIKKKKRRQNK